MGNYRNFLVIVMALIMVLGILFMPRGYAQETAHKGIMGKIENNTEKREAEVDKGKMIEIGETPGKNKEFSKEETQGNKTKGETEIGEKTDKGEKEAAEENKENKMKNPHLAIETSMGRIEVELLPDEAPITVKNFLEYTKEGFYDGTIFHRVISNFMIQGGGFTPDMVQKPTKPPIKNEATNKLNNDKGTLAMARTPVIDSATSQFFINLKDNIFLNHRTETSGGYGYCVFGKVIKGIEVVEAIGKVPTTSKGMHKDVPVTPVLIKSIRVTK